MPISMPREKTESSNILIHDGKDVELADKDLKTAIINRFHMLKNSKKNMDTRDMGDMENNKRNF